MGGTAHRQPRLGAGPRALAPWSPAGRDQSGRRRRRPTCRRCSSPSVDVGRLLSSRRMPAMSVRCSTAALLPPIVTVGGSAPVRRLRIRRYPFRLGPVACLGQRAVALSGADTPPNGCCPLVFRSGCWGARPRGWRFRGMTCGGWRRLVAVRILPGRLARPGHGSLLAVPGPRLSRHPHRGLVAVAMQRCLDTGRTDVRRALGARGGHRSAGGTSAGPTAGRRGARVGGCGAG